MVHDHLATSSSSFVVGKLVGSILALVGSMVVGSKAVGSSFVVGSMAVGSILVCKVVGSMVLDSKDRGRSSSLTTLQQLHIQLLKKLKI